MTVFAYLASLLMMLVASPASAHASSEPSFAPSCHATSGLDRGFESMASKANWTCSNDGWSASAPVGWVRFEREAWDGEERPRFFYTRIARYKAIEIAALDSDGTLRVESHTESDGMPFPSGPVFQLPLPEIKAETVAVLVRVERPHAVTLLTDMRLAHYPESADWSQVEMMLIALVIGMLILPLMFDISFYIVLRERFVALHAMMVISMMTYVFFAGGLISVFVSLPVIIIAIIAPLSWAIGTGMAALFLAEFLEPGTQCKYMRKITLGVGVWTMLVPGFCALQLHATQPFDDQAYFLTFIPALVLITFAVIAAVIRGSRSARFVAIAWLPIIAASTDRLFRGLGLYIGPSNLDQMLYVATGLEVIMISLAIGDRFLAIRRERDEAVTEARMLERLSERDPLTGLMNRRAVEERFTGLRKDGFDTFALIDLDRFKDVNDRFGHQVGDAALVACSAAIRGTDERDTIAVRLGGEEFVVLLRGKHARQRAEALRQAIPLRIATDLPGLDRPVTASMGLIELPRASHDMMDFTALYARADTLLYEAKSSGRNRIQYEKLTVFGAAPQRRISTENGSDATDQAA